MDQQAADTLFPGGEHLSLKPGIAYRRDPDLPDAPEVWRAIGSMRRQRVSQAQPRAPRHLEGLFVDSAWSLP